MSEYGIGIPSSFNGYYIWKSTRDTLWFVGEYIVSGSGSFDIKHVRDKVYVNAENTEERLLNTTSRMELRRSHSYNTLSPTAREWHHRKVYVTTHTDSNGPYCRVNYSGLGVDSRLTVYTLGEPLSGIPHNAYGLFSTTPSNKKVIHETLYPYLLKEINYLTSYHLVDYPEDLGTYISYEFHIYNCSKYPLIFSSLDHGGAIYVDRVNNTTYRVRVMKPTRTRNIEGHPKVFVFTRVISEALKIQNNYGFELYDESGNKFFSSEYAPLQLFANPSFAEQTSVAENWPTSTVTYSEAPHKDIGMEYSYSNYSAMNTHVNGFELKLYGFTNGSTFSVVRQNSVYASGTGVSVGRHQVLYHLEGEWGTSTRFTGFEYTRITDPKVINLPIIESWLYEEFAKQVV